MKSLENESSSCCDPVRVSLRWSIIHICFSSITIFHSVYALATDHYSPVSRHFTDEIPSTKVLRRSTELRIAASFLAIVFSALLYYGVTKRKSSYVKAYYIYGVINVILGVLVTVSLGVWGDMHGTTDYLFVVLVLVISLFYALILEMVRRTYLLFDISQDRLKLFEDQYV